MATILLAFAPALAHGQAAPSGQADAIEGVWADENGDMEMEVSGCGAAYCAEIVSLTDALDGNGRPRVDVENPNRALRARPLIGLEIISDLAYDPEGSWRGTMYAPFKGRRVNVTFTLDDPDTLRAEVSKFIFRKTLMWTRRP